MHSTASLSLLEFLSLFATCFCSSNTHQNFLTLVLGWILCPSRRSISRILQAASAYHKHHSAFYNFFTRAQWFPDSLGQVLFLLIEPLCPGLRLYAPLDDTLAEKSGPHIFGIGFHYDAKRSHYGKSGKKQRRNRFALGHRFVVLSIYVQAPWNPKKGFALPVLVRLYRSKKRCPEGEFKKSTELAREMVLLLASWLEGKKRQLVVTCDREYACRTLIRDLPHNISVVGPIPKKAALYDFPEQHKGRGRPRVKGKRLPNPQQFSDEDSAAWQALKLNLYGQKVEIEMKQQVCLWYGSCGSRAVRVVVTRDPKGNFEKRCFFSTDLAQGAAWVLRSVAKRWSLEVSFRDCKQELGFEDAQNGWWRHEKGLRREKWLAGPTEHKEERGKRAVERTAPLCLLIYSMVVLWYLRNGRFQEDINRAKERAPWYGQKAGVSFKDMLWSIRDNYWEERLLREGHSPQGLSKIISELRPLASTG